ncbi:hypothetical protein XENTR_v10001500 [Xenopus tropicalis]|nr:hypothetical protein XENTR_v10001500 [Xenopus tropicalis]
MLFICSTHTLFIWKVFLLKWILELQTRKFTKSQQCPIGTKINCALTKDTAVLIMQQYNTHCFIIPRYKWIYVPA